jgi:peptidoglycan/LPS O-acetylase OafA/YrhL
MRAKLLYLEALRGFAAVAVALLHFSNTSPVTENRFIQHSDTMVDFFFVLSGFVIAYNYSERVRDFASLVEFQSRRFWRLYPLHLVGLLAFLALETAQYAYEQYTGSPGAFPAFSTNTPLAFVQNLLLVHPLFQGDTTFNYPSWSIAAEFYTYLGFGLLLLAPRAFRPAAIVAVAFAAAITLAALGGIRQLYGLSFVRCAYSFSLGVLTYWVAKPLQPGHARLYFGGPMLAVTVALVCLPEYFPQVLLPIPFAACIGLLIVEAPTSPLKRFLSLPAVVHLGTISYGIYMLHALVWEVFLIVLLKGLGYPLRADGVTVALTPWPHTAALLVGMTVIIAAADWSYRLIEQPWRRR